MAINKVQWIRLSIFVHPDDVPLSSKQCIRPWLHQLNRAKVLVSYELMLNSEGGNNLRLALLVKSPFLSQIAKQTDEHFNIFFEKNTKNFKSQKIDHAQLLFMPYPCNSIQYGLYSKSTRRHQEAEIKLNKALSKALLFAFTQCNSIGIESRFTIALYLSISASEAFNNKVEVIKAFSAESMAEFNTLSQGDIDEIEQNFLEMRATITEIMHDIAATKTSNELMWLRKWQDSLFQALGSLSFNLNYPIYLISFYLDLNKISSIMLKYFLSKVLIKPLL